MNYKDPKIGAWGNGENVGHLAYFVNIQKANNGEPTASQNKPEKNPYMHPREDPPAQARPAPAKSEPQQKAQSKVHHGARLRFRRCAGRTKTGHSHVNEEIFSSPVEQSGGNKNEVVNSARFPVLNKDLLARRAGALASADDPHTYGGSTSLQVGQRGSNDVQLGEAKYDLTIFTKNNQSVTQRGIMKGSHGNGGGREVTVVEQSGDGNRKVDCQIGNQIMSMTAPKTLITMENKIPQVGTW